MNDMINSFNNMLTAVLTCLVCVVAIVLRLNSGYVGDVDVTEVCFPKFCSAE